MKVLVVRHAIAEDRESFSRTGREDADRPLTAAGRRKFARAVRGLVAAEPSVAVVATSPFARAAETAELVRDAYGLREVTRLAELEPESDPSALLAWLRRRRGAGVVAVVGHEPHLSTFVALAIAGVRRADALELRKGGACLVDVGAAVQPGHGTLLWLLTPRQLRRLG
jgi:phosphohistidine phosphatase